jgi:hypothetical protein
MAPPIDMRIIGSPPTDWWNIGLTVAATIIGALIGASIAYFIARQAANENRDVAKSTRRANEEAATLRAVVKFMELVNSIGGYYIGGEATISKGMEVHRKALRTGIETWVVMLPQVGKPQEVRIEPDDLIAFTRSREFKFVTDLLNLCSAHNSMITGSKNTAKDAMLLWRRLRRN